MVPIWKITHGWPLCLDLQQSSQSWTCHFTISRRAINNAEYDFKERHGIMHSSVESRSCCPHRKLPNSASKHCCWVLWKNLDENKRSWLLSWSFLCWSHTFLPSPPSLPFILKMQEFKNITLRSWKGPLLIINRRSSNIGTDYKVNLLHIGSTWEGGKSLKD